MAEALSHQFLGFIPPVAGDTMPGMHGGQFRLLPAADINNKWTPCMKAATRRRVDRGWYITLQQDPF
jgi:hypothetical protein